MRREEERKKREEREEEERRRGGEDENEETGEAEESNSPDARPVKSTFTIMHNIFVCLLTSVDACLSLSTKALFLCSLLYMFEK